MLTRPLMLLFTLCLLFAAAAPSAAQGVGSDGGADAGSEGAAASPADEAVAPLLEQFQRLSRSLQDQPALSEEDRPVVERFRERVAEFNAAHPDHAAGLAMELQLSMWLQDHERVEELFERLVAVADDPGPIGTAWAGYVERHGGPERVEAVYDRLADLLPDNVELQMNIAQRDRDANRYRDALRRMESLTIDYVTQPEAARLLAELLFAEHRFQDALDTLDRIPAETLQSRPRLASTIERDREQYVEYTALWQEELQKRALEASADDLPRVRLQTSRGDIVVELFENEAPNTVANFINLVESGFYDSTRFHRVEPNFMAQGGDPNTKPGATGRPGIGGPGYFLPGEHEAEDARMHFAGSLAIAKQGDRTSGSQFYLTVRPTPWLNRQHTVFGRVLEGLDIVRSLEVDDELISATVLRKRDHEYTFETLGESAAIDRTGGAPSATSGAAGATQNRSTGRE